MGETRIQHKVPQLLLRNFTSGKKKQLHVFDKQTGRRFQTVPQKVAAERDYYTRLSDGASFEPVLCAAENEVAPIVRKLLLEQRLGGISRDEKMVLAMFSALQKLRGDYMRQGLVEMQRLLFTVLEDEEGYQIGGQPLEVPDSEQAKQMSLDMMMQTPQFTQHFLDKEWQLLKAAPGTDYYIGDNPVVLQNLYDYGPRGSLGLGLPGIEIYLPLSSEIALCFRCRTLNEQIRVAYKKVAEFVESSPTARATFADTIDLVKSMETGMPSRMKAESMENVNALQVAFSSRYVYSASGNFELVQDMIRKNPDIRGGLKPVIAT